MEAESNADKDSSAEHVQAVDRDAIKRRRRWLYAFAGLAVIAVAAFAGLQLLGGDSEKEKADRAEIKPPVILERIELLPVRGASGRGLAEFVRRTDREGLRVLAANLKPSLDGEVYQLLLAGGKSEPKLLGNVKVGENKTFIGEAKLTGEVLHGYRRIEIRRVGQGNPPTDKLILRGKIPA